MSPSCRFGHHPRHHASTPLAGGLRRLLNESKKHFDIICRYRPDPGQHRSSLVCAAADRTILTVARGQQRRCRTLDRSSAGHRRSPCRVGLQPGPGPRLRTKPSGIALRKPLDHTHVLASRKQRRPKDTSGSFKRAGMRTRFVLRCIDLALVFDALAIPLVFRPRRPSTLKPLPGGGGDKRSFLALLLKPLGLRSEVWN